jgi:energy-coupling factor transporter ATP-binding protein EcfA2
MKIKSIQLKNFKRFTDLTLENIPEQAKLVLLIGANGSGKSSVFDGFRKALIPPFGQGYSSDYPIPKLEVEVENFYKKANSDEAPITNIQLHSGEVLGSNGINNTIPIANYWLRKFIGRSSIRILPKILHQINTVDIEKDEDSPVSFIENDNRFQNDLFAYMQAINQQMQEFFFNKKPNDDGSQIFQDFIQPLNNSLRNIFENADGENDNKPQTNILRIVGFENITSSEPAKLIFQKGGSKINYDLLSHGEKQVVILLLNFIVRKKQYEDSIIYIDEMDCHLNTALQENLLKEIVEEWIPDSSQLWTASHALGFIDYARKTDDAVILDFDSLDFDVPQIIIPQSKEVLEVYDIAIPKSILSQLFNDKKIVFCENKNDEYYNLMGIEKTLFVGVKDSRAVFLNVKNDKSKFTLRDRDFISDEEIIRIQKSFPNHRILKYYNFENYLYHPENIAELSPVGFGKEKYKSEIIQQKKDKIHYILPKIEAARKTYEEFKTDFTEKDIKNYKDIVDDFVSDDFERFYKFFDMKDQFNRSHLAQFNLTIKGLSSTNWFKTQIEKILQ